MNKNNLFVLRSPLQILNAIEAIEHFNLKDNILVLIFNSLDTNTNQINELIALHQWKEVIKLEDRSKSKLFRYVKLVKELKKYEFDYFFFGNLGTIQKILIANIKKEYVYLLDDGTSSIMYYDKYIKHNKVNKYNFREIRFLAFGLKIKIKDKINLFTYFDLESINGIKIVKNTLASLKNNYLSQIKKDQNIYFIGQPLDDVNVLSIDNYIKVLESLSKFYNKKIIYIPHRSESRNLQDANNLINNKYIEILQSNMPVEIYFLEKKIHPFMIVSYFSTALSTLKFLFNQVEIKVVEIPFSKIGNKDYYYDFLENYYNNVNNSNKITFDELKI